MNKLNLHGMVLHQRVNLVFVYTDGKKRVALDSPDFAYATRFLQCVSPWICGVFVNSKKPTGLIRHRNTVVYPQVKNKITVGFPEGKPWKGDGIARHRGEYEYKLKSILRKAKEFMALGIDKKAALIAARNCSCQVH